MNADDMAALIIGTINKTGGIEKWRQLREEIQRVKATGGPDAMQQFVRRISKSGPGSRQFVSLALLGLTCGEIVHQGNQRRSERN